MQHPFDGIVEPVREADERGSAALSRRRALKTAAAAGIGALAWPCLRAARGAALVPTTMAVGEEGGPGPVRRPPSERIYRAFQSYLKRGDLAGADRYRAQLRVYAKTADGKRHYEQASAALRAKLEERLKQADADAADDKYVEAIRGYRAVSRIAGFPQQAQAKERLAAMKKADCCGEAFREAEAQDLYEAAMRAHHRRRRAMLRDIARRYPDTPTGKKAAAEAGTSKPPGRPGITTRAVGEEGGKLPPPGRATTMAVGEEG